MHFFNSPSTSWYCAFEFQRKMYSLIHRSYRFFNLKLYICHSLYKSSTQDWICKGSTRNKSEFSIESDRIFAPLLIILLQYLKDIYWCMYQFTKSSCPILPSRRSIVSPFFTLIASNKGHISIQFHFGDDKNFTYCLFRSLNKPLKRC